ncbi:glycosyltransferase [Hymenobacter sp. GOD-10R]|uniref:glycosyltransferase n=1 Tax=Hymenobacter sp. GOD-10R TaxID=3093922 RepID=UPI002D773E21|nr:glycosyltransferase [Hymenobacter sp. GOD-10R]WRQ30132.1 glycosyltransferase [Hymenobacter sp. GOD-10R]
MTTYRILFATMPFDGHFSPLTGLAVHLQQLGHDVRWYVGGHYGERVKNLGLPHYPLVQAKLINQENLDELLPERAKLKSPIARGQLDVTQVFLLRAPEYVQDIRAIHQDWPFDILIYDEACLGAVLAQQLLGVKGVAIGVMPLMETDENLGPPGLGQQPARSGLGRLGQRILSYVVQRFMFKPCNELYNQLRAQHGLPPFQGFLFDSVFQYADLFLQSGVPAFEYPRKRISPTVKFVGALLPHRSSQKAPFKYISQALAHKHVVLVTQGTLERNVEKIIVPTLEAYKDNADTLVIATTGGSGTEELRRRYPQRHFIIEDFIDFDAVMPYASVYVTNGGYGGVMLALQHQLPMVVAGVYEGKNEIAGRVDYCRVGINLKTETPKPKQIRQAVTQVLTTSLYRQQVRQLAQEFQQYHPHELATTYLQEMMTRASQPAPHSSLAQPISAS